MKVIRFIPRVIAVAFMIGMISSCGVSDSGSSSTGTEPIDGEPTPLGAVGNGFSTSVMGITDMEMGVTQQNGDISTIRFEGRFIDDNLIPAAAGLLELAETNSDMSLDGNQMSGTREFRITTKGFQDVFPDGSCLTIINYDAKEGDTYRKKMSGGDLVRKVVKVSNDDDFPWGFMYIKTVKVEETGSRIPGVSKIVYYGNHKFGLVGMDIIFEDGSERMLNVFSDNYNE